LSFSHVVICQEKSTDLRTTLLLVIYTFYRITAVYDKMNYH